MPLESAGCCSPIRGSAGSLPALAMGSISLYAAAATWVQVVTAGGLLVDLSWSPKTESLLSDARDGSFQALCWDGRSPVASYH